jgi:probable biosynthetic protein (TIGR04099 family)
VIVGMPHMSYGGLSESWLLKEMGHLHWRAAAQHFGQTRADFRDEANRRLYASFVAVSVKNLALFRAHEFDAVRLACRLNRVGASQLASRQVLTRKGQVLGQAELLSSFMARTREYCNRTVERGAFGASPECGPPHHDAPLRTLLRDMRAGTWASHMGFEREARKPVAERRFRPCPQNDFNGARFLYFAAFQALTDRAEWDWQLGGPELWTTVQRDLFYHGNADVGENVTVRLLAWRGSGTELAHWCEVIRDTDGVRIADVFTHKVPAGLPVKVFCEPSDALRAAGDR